MTRYYIIINPISGRGSGLRHKDLLENFVKEHKLNYELVVSERPGHALELAREAVINGFDVIVSAGGDGTANEVLNGILESNSAAKRAVSMAVIPVGRGNDFAYSMGVPIDFDAACQKLLDPAHGKHVDVGKVVGGNFPKGRYFGNGVGIGFDAVVGFEAVKLKFLTGFPSYIVAALKTIFLYYKPAKLSVQLDDALLEGKYLMVSIMNGIRMGGGFYMAPNGSPTDGKFTLCVVNDMGKLATFPMIMKFMKGSQADDPQVKMLSSTHVKVKALSGSIPCHADGETVCENGTTVEVELVPAAIHMLV
ncbi:MAG: hypothetical protein C0391_04570 [Anaerolinea sp.]|nr:hypothetical protein [Anaerolinea sp.]